MPGIRPSLFAAPVAPVSASVNVAVSPSCRHPKPGPEPCRPGAVSAMACAFSWVLSRLLKVTKMAVTVSALGSSEAVTETVELVETPTPLLKPVKVMGFDPPTVICADERSARGRSRTLTARTNRPALGREDRPGNTENGEGNMASKPQIVEPTAYFEGSVDGMRLERQESPAVAEEANRIHLIVTRPCQQ